MNFSYSLLLWVTSPDFLSGMSITNNPIVNYGWGEVRNIANIVLIFGLIVIAISIILGLQEGRAKKTLVNFILIALLINFTPVICGLIIDACNLVMNSFLNGMVISTSPKDIIIGAFDVSSNSSPSDLLLGKFMYFIFSLFAAVIYLLYALLFMARYVVLWILVIASPLAFASKVLPKYDFVNKLFPKVFYWDEWWNQFLQWCILGITAGFSLYLSNSIITMMKGGAMSIASPTTGTAANYHAILEYAIPFVFLVVGFFVSMDSGGKVGSFLGGVATGAWAASGGKIAKGITDRAKAGGEWATERLGAAGSRVKEGAIGAAGVMMMDQSTQPIPMSMLNKEDRELGRQAIAGWKKRAVQGTPLKYLSTPPSLEKDKDKAMDNYNQNWSRYNPADRDKIEKMLIDKDTSSFLKGGAGDAKEYQRRLAAISRQGNDKSKFEAYLHASGHMQLMASPNATANKRQENLSSWAATNKVDVADKLQSLSSKDAKDKLSAEAIRENPEIIKNMNAKNAKNIMEQGSDEQKRSMRDAVLNRNKNAAFMDYMKEQKNIATGNTPGAQVFQTQGSDEEEKAKIAHDRAKKVIREVYKNTK
jgi:hypothetical protein